MMEDVKQMERETDYPVEGEDDEVDMMVNEAAQELKEDTREHKVAVRQTKSIAFKH